MPTYDYRCMVCGYEFEFFQSMKDEPLKECPHCQGRLKRLIGPGAGPIFKGSGFYQTDYKNSASKETKKVQKPKTENKSKSIKKND